MNAQVRSQSSVAYSSLLYVWLSLNKMSSKQLFYEKNIRDLLSMNVSMCAKCQSQVEQHKGASRIQRASSSCVFYISMT